MSLNMYNDNTGDTESYCSKYRPFNRDTRLHSQFMICNIFCLQNQREHFSFYLQLDSYSGAIISYNSSRL